MYDCVAISGPARILAECNHQCTLQFMIHAWPDAVMFQHMQPAP